MKKQFLRSLVLLTAFALPVAISYAGTQVDLAGPAGSGAFGTSVTVLPNGNFVVTDPSFDQVSPALANVGAVYLYRPDGLVISSLKGSSASDAVGPLHCLGQPFSAISNAATSNFVEVRQSHDQDIIAVIFALAKGKVPVVAPPLCTISSLALKPANDPTGAGGRGQAQAIGSAGDVVVYIIGDRKLTELVMLPP